MSKPFHFSRSFPLSPQRGTKACFIRRAAAVPNLIDRFKVARYSFSRSIPPKFKRKLRRHKQRFGKLTPQLY